MSFWDKLGFNSGSSNQPATVVVQQAPEQKEEVKEEPAPMEAQAGWFKPADTDAKQEEFDASKLFNADPAKLQEALGNLNFFQGSLTPDVMAKIEAGGQEGVQATLALVNKSNQQVMAAALQASSKMIEQAVSKVQPVMDQKVTQHLKAQQVETAIRDSNPVFQTEAGQFMVDALKKAFITKFPNATSQELQDNAKSFVNDFIKLGGPQTEAPKGAKADTDWNAILSDMR